MKNKKQIRKIINLLYVAGFIYTLVGIFIIGPSPDFHPKYVFLGVILMFLLVTGEVLIKYKL